MNTYHKIPIEILAYAAGIIDGEGCIRIGKYTEPKSGELRYRTQLQVGMTDKKVIEWLKQNLGGNLYIGKTSHNNKKPCYYWMMSTKKAAILLKVLLPYLIAKKEQALLLIKFAENIQQGKRRMNTTINKERAILAERSLALNKKGVNS